MMTGGMPILGNHHMSYSPMNNDIIMEYHWYTMDIHWYAYSGYSLSQSNAYHSETMIYNSLLIGDSWLWMMVTSDAGYWWRFTMMLDDR